MCVIISYMFEEVKNTQICYIKDNKKNLQTDMKLSLPLVMHFLPLVWQKIALLFHFILGEQLFTTNHVQSYSYCGIQVEELDEGLGFVVGRGREMEELEYWLPQLLLIIGWPDCCCCTWL